MCDQQRLRPACAYAQSDQSLCYSLEYSMNIKLLTEQYLEFLSLKGGCTGSSESIHVKMPHCWKSPVTVQMDNTIFIFSICMGYLLFQYQGSHKNSKTQFHDFSTMFHDQQCNFNDYFMHGFQPPLLATSSPC